MKYSVSEDRGTGDGVKITGLLLDTGGKDGWRNILEVDFRRLYPDCIRWVRARFSIAEI